MKAELVKLSNVSRGYRSKAGIVAALEGVNCVIERGDSVAITGPSGSGKTTLLAVMAGLEQPDSGEVIWPELAMPLRPRQIGVSFQVQSLLPSLTVAQNIEMPLLISGAPEPHASRIVEALALVGLSGFEDRYPDELSGGQSQRAALARAMVTRPRLLLADEPTGHLDQITGNSIVVRLLSWTKSRGISLVLATHDPSIFSLFKRIWHMDHGILKES